tara:strand:+ start:515 stop:712 length:198 start_codon:yes stop_codon:yes gene_type:complete
MKIGDLVEWNGKTGVVVRVYKHKVWRTHERGVNVNWRDTEPEPFADVMIAGTIIRLPQIDLKLVK